MISLLFSDTTQESTLPIFEYLPPKYTAERILKILLVPTIPDHKVCKVKPTCITSSATFVVDVRNLQCINDIKKDEFRIWHSSGSHPQAYRVYTEKDGYISVERCANNAKGSSVVLVRRLRCTHSSSPEFKCLTCCVSGRFHVHGGKCIFSLSVRRVPVQHCCMLMGLKLEILFSTSLTDAWNNPRHLCLVCYRLDSRFIPTLSSHQNAKKKPFFPTWPSPVKEECSSLGPKATIEQVSGAVGGVMSASAPGQLPRNEK